VFGKMVGAYTGGRLIGLDHWRSLAYGSALNARGAVEIIIATIGLSLGILSQDMYSIIVLMAVTTSLMAPALLRWSLQHVVPDEQESKRLRLEELASDSLLGRVNRVLLPVRQREGANRFAIQKVETHLVGKLGSDLAVTLFNVTPQGSRNGGVDYLNDMAQLFSASDLSKKVVESDKPVEAILDEAQKDYDLIILGASEKASGSDILFNPLTDQLVRLSPCPTMIVKGTRVAEHWPPRRILVPTNGSASSRSAAEVAFVLARDENVQVTLLNVVEVEKRGDYRFDSSGRSRERQLSNAHQIVESLRLLGEAQEVKAETQVRVEGAPETVILEIAEGYDLIVLGTGARASLERVFLGPRVEAILDQATCPVIVVNGA
jgi:nucleotide-binding universal stress UspA family protein